MSHRVQLAGSELHFSCATSTSVLDADLSLAVVLTHSRKDGRCGECKIRMLEGEPRVFSSSPPDRMWLINLRWNLD